MKRILCSVFLAAATALLLVSAALAVTPTLEHANVSAIANQTYTGAKITPDLSVELYGQALVEGVDYAVSYTDNLYPGTATATITGIGALSGTKEVPFAILLRDISDARVSVASCTADSFTREYTPDITVTLDEKTLSADSDYRVRYQNNTCAGTAYAIIEGTGGYTGRKVKSFTIKNTIDETAVYLTYNNRESSSAAAVNSKVTLYGKDVINYGMVSSVTVKSPSNTTVYTGGLTSSPYDNSAVKIGSFTPTTTGTYTISYRISSYDLVVSGGRYVCRPKAGGTIYTQKLMVSASNSNSATINSLSLSPYYPACWSDGYDTIYLNPVVSVSSTKANSNLTWRSSNTSVATVDSWGKVTLLAPGTTNITVSAPGGISASLPIDIAAIELSSAIKGVILYRREHGYDFCAMTDYGALSQGADYAVSYKEDGAYVDVTLTGRGLFTGQVQHRILRPMLSSLGSTMQRTGEIVLEIAPGMYSGSGAIVTAAYDKDGRFIGQKRLPVPDLSQGTAVSMTMDLDPDGSFKTFFLDDRNNPLGEASGDLSNPPLTKEEQAALDAAAKKAAEICRTYAVENAHTVSSGIYKSDFTANGYTGGMWYISDDKDFTISTKGPSLVINLTLGSDGYLESTFSYDKITGGKYYIGIFSIDPSTYSLNDSAHLVRYATSDALTGEAEKAFISEASFYYSRMVNMLNTFLRGYGLSAGDVGVNCFK